MRKNRTLKILLVSLGCLLILFSLSACQSPETPDTGETDTEMTEPKETQESQFTVAFREGILKGQDATVINNRLYLYDHLISFWEKEGNDATVTVTIRAYDIYDLDPLLDSTLYDGKTYAEYYYLHNTYDQLTRIYGDRFLENPTDQQVITDYQNSCLGAKDTQNMMEYIREEQRTRKMQKIVDLLRSVGVNASVDEFAITINATISKEDIMVLTEADCLFLLVYDSMKMPAVNH